MLGVLLEQLGFLALHQILDLANTFAEESLVGQLFSFGLLILLPLPTPLDTFLQLDF